MAIWVSKVRLILGFLAFWCDAKKSSFVDALPMDQQFEQIAPWSAKLSPKGLTPFSEGAVLRPWVPQDQLKVKRFGHWTIQKGSRHAVGPKARRTYISIFYNNIYCSRSLAGISWIFNIYVFWLRDICYLYSYSVFSHIYIYIHILPIVWVLHRSDSTICFNSTIQFNSIQLDEFGVKEASKAAASAVQHWLVELNWPVKLNWNVELSWIVESNWIVESSLLLESSQAYR